MTASEDKTARVWDAATGKAIAVLTGHQGPVNSAAFNPDGSRIVTASGDKTARVWDAATGKAIAVLNGHDGPLRSPGFSRNGWRIVTVDDKTARLWDATTWREIAALNGHDAPVPTAAFGPFVFGVIAAFSPDGTRVVTAADDNIARVWDAATGHAIAVLKGHNGPILSAAFSPDGTRVVTSSLDTTMRLWNATTGRELAVSRGDYALAFRSEGHLGSIDPSAFSPDGTRVVMASENNTARILDATTWRDIAILSGHSAAFNPDSRRVVTASDDGTVRIWDVGAIPKGNILQVRLRALAHARGSRQPRRRHRLSADLRPADLRHRTSRAGPLGRPT